MFKKALISSEKEQDKLFDTTPIGRSKRTKHNRSRFRRQLKALCRKNLLLFKHHWIMNLVCALILPVSFYVFLGYSKFLLAQPSTLGVSSPKQIAALNSVGLCSPIIYIDHVTNSCSQRLRSQISDRKAECMRLIDLKDENEIPIHCPENYNGKSRCLGAIIINQCELGSDPKIDYKIRHNSGLGQTFVDTHKSDSEVYLLPLQNTIDECFFELSGIKKPPVPSAMPFTMGSQFERNELYRYSFLRGMYNITIIAFSVVYLGIVYQLVGAIVEEREAMITSLLTSMGCRRCPRILSWSISYSLLYFLGWILMGVVNSKLFFTKSNAAGVVFFHVCIGLMMVSWSIFISNFFKHAMLSSIISVVAVIVLAIIVQIIKLNGWVWTIALGVIFPPTLFSFGMLSFTEYEKDALALHWANQNDYSSIPFLLIFLLVIFDWLIFPVLAYYLEGYLYFPGKVLHISRSEAESVMDNLESSIMTIKNVRKVYNSRSLLRKKRTVVAVDDVSLDIKKNHIFCLLGSNGSGKSTLISIISGMAPRTSGSISLGPYDIDELPDGLISICPQKNVLWNSLTVFQHLEIWKDIKSESEHDLTDIGNLIDSCDLTEKRNFKASGLSGGQKRKLQLAIAYIGGSKICLVDEVSSGLDPLSRQKIWEVILKYRELGKTIILTTHYLDEAEELGDYVSIMKLGRVLAFGPLDSIKQEYGGGYAITVTRDLYEELSPENLTKQMKNENMEVILKSIQTKIPDAVAFSDVTGEITIWPGSNFAQIAEVLQDLEIEKRDKKIRDYSITGPTIDEAFLNCIEAPLNLRNESKKLFTFEPRKLDDNPSDSPSQSAQDERLLLSSMMKIGLICQIKALLLKRWWLFKKSQWKTWLSALFVALITCGVSLLFLKDYTSTCTRIGRDPATLGLTFPPSALGEQSVLLYYGKNLSDLRENPVLLNRNSTLTFNNQYEKMGSAHTVRDLHKFSISVMPISNSSELIETIQKNHSKIPTGGVWFEEDSAILAWNNENFKSGLSFFNVISNLQYNRHRGKSNERRIKAEIQPFNGKLWGDATQALKFLLFYALSLAVYPAFSALNATTERLRKVRALHYSNGLQPVSLWLANLIYELPIIFITSILSLILLQATNSAVWNYIGLHWLTLVLYGICATLFGFLLSFIPGNALGAFALVAGLQAILLILYVSGTLLILTFMPPQAQDRAILIIYYTMALLSPIVSMGRSVFIGINLFGFSCTEGGNLPKDFGSLRLYGGPILYLILFSILYFVLIIAKEQGWTYRVGAVLSSIRPTRDRKNNTFDDEKHIGSAFQKFNTVSSVENVISVRHLKKRFKKFVAIDDLSFEVGKGELLSLLGPNGAGKTTTLNILRGDTAPSSGHAIVEGHDILRERALARRYLGVCPQFDAFDDFTVEKHLQFYAAVKGIPTSLISREVAAVIQEVGLQSYGKQLARTLSGGYQRKLSMAIALLGNPLVLLIDEVSSGMDISAKRIIWQTIKQIKSRHAIIMTTHSMEEADALASKIGIMCQRMLAEDTIMELRRSYRNGYLVRVTLDGETTPHRIEQVDIALKEWFPGCQKRAERRSSRLRYFLPIQAGYSVADIFRKFVDTDESLGIKYLNISPTSLQDLFTEIVGDTAKEE